MDLSFSGAGFMGCYYFGVVNCWNKYIPRDRVRRVAGASAGTLIAAYYLMDLPLDECLKEIIELTEDIRRRPLGVFDRSNQIVDVLPRALDKMFPADAHKRVSGRLYVCMTRLKDMKAVTVNEFETRQDLIDALNCSCFIPVWSGNHVATYKGVKHIDGGFTNNLPVFDEHTIRICCFAGASDIAPIDRSQADFMSGTFQGMPFYLNWKNMRRGRRALWPPPPSYIIELLERGFHDAKDFILSNDLIQCDRCYKSAEMEYQPIYSKIAPTISPNLSRAGSFSDKSRKNSASGRDTLESSVSVDKFSSLFSSSLDSCNNATGELGAATSKRAEQGSDNRLTSVGRQRTSSASTNDGRWPRQAETKPAVSAILERRRSKSGKQISLDSLELASQIKQEAAQALASRNANQVNETDSKSLVSKLRDKLTRRASKSSLTDKQLQQQQQQQREEAQNQDCERAIQLERVFDTIDDEGEDADDDGTGRPASPGMPIIVIDEAIREAQMELDMTDSAGGDDKQAQVTPELDTSDHIEPDSKRRHQDSTSNSGESAASASSLDSSSSSSGGGGGSTSDVGSDDSAVGLNDARKPNYQTGAVWTKTRPGGSLGDKFLASRRQSLAIADQLNAELGRQQKQNSLLPDRFSFAPSQLPSCPPSPNLNRHCTECIRLRQEARLDGIDDSIRREAAKYGSIGSKEPEKEFSSIKYKISNWFRQFGATKYYYSFDDEFNADSQAPHKDQKSPQASPNRRRASEIPDLS